jgi:hypothetical protein
MKAAKKLPDLPQASKMQKGLVMILVPILLPTAWQKPLALMTAAW